MIASPLLIKSIRAAVCFRTTAQAVENGFVDRKKAKTPPLGEAGSSWGSDGEPNAAVLAPRVLSPRAVDATPAEADVQAEE